MGDALDQGAKKRAQRDAALRQRQLASQKQKERLRAAEAEDETSRRKAVAKKGGTRASLLTGAETGRSKTLG